MKKLSVSAEHSMVTRIVTALVFGAILGPSGILGGWYLLVASFFLVGFATYEVLTLPGKGRYNAGIWIVTYLAVYSLVYWQFLKSDAIRDLVFQGNLFYLDNFSVSLIAIMVYLGLLFLISFFWANFRVEDIFYLFTMVILVSLGFYSLLFLRYFPIGAAANAGDGYPLTLGGTSYDIGSGLLFWWAIFGVFASDIGAYFTGIFFGKHPMNVRISPHKTWEGFVGGTVFSLVFSYAYVAIAGYVSHTPMIPNLIDVAKDPSDWGWVTLLSLSMPLFDNMGGFLFSAVKRKYGAKDWGFILPGHGGILDRFDGCLFNAIAMAIFLVMIDNNWILFF